MNKFDVVFSHSGLLLILSMPLSVTVNPAVCIGPSSAVRGVVGSYVGVCPPVKSNIGLPVVGAKYGVGFGLVVGVPVFPSGNVGSSVGGFVGLVISVVNIEGLGVGRIEGLLV